MTYSIEAMDEACSELKRRIKSYEPRVSNETIVYKKSKTMYIVKNRKTK